jgi:hypothetical protein
VRWSLAVLLISGLNLCAQQQERSLIDRLLRPDMKLQNDSQSKKFVTQSAGVERRGTVGTFFLRSNARQKSFSDTPILNTNQYRTSSFNGDIAPNSVARGQNAAVPKSIEPSTARDVGNSLDAGRTVPTRNFTGQREFREEGKAQKFLNQNKPPLTIEQVRELLNKNK